MKVRIDYLFSKNNKIGSRFISWGTKHLYNVENTPSHIALLVNDRWVHESTLFTGVRVVTYKKWLEINEEVAKIPCVNERDYSDIKAIFRDIIGKKYDWGGVCYLGIYLSLNKLRGVKIPEENKWESPDKYFCCEAVAKLTKVENFAMKAPVDLMVKFKELS